MNSSAALKAFVGEHGGAVCTSTNARAVLDWAFADRRRGRRRPPGPVLPRPAPRPQHRLPAGLRRGRHAGVEPPASTWAGSTDADVKEATLPAVEGPLLGPPALPARARRRLPGRAPRRHRDRPPRVRPRACASWPTRSARPTSSSRPSRRPRPGRPSASATEIHLVQRLDAETPGQDGRVARPADLPVLDHVPHRRRRTWAGCSRTWSTGEVVNRITVGPDDRGVGQGRPRAHARHHLRRFSQPRRVAGDRRRASGSPARRSDPR